MSDDGMVCSSCKQTRNNLTVKNSKLLKTTKLNLCNECLKQGREPRWLIILVGRSQGAARVHEYVIKKKYVGEPILYSELMANPTN